jgi:hypothetical protein
LFPRHRYQQPVAIKLAKLVSKFAAIVADNGGKFAAGVVDTGGKFDAGVVDNGGKFSTGVVVRWGTLTCLGILENILNGPNGILWGWGETDP